LVDHVAGGPGHGVPRQVDLRRRRRLPREAGGRREYLAHARRRGRGDAAVVLPVAEQVVRRADLELVLGPGLQAGDLERVALVGQPDLLPDSVDLLADVDAVGGGADLSRRTPGEVDLVGGDGGGREVVRGEAVVRGVGGGGGDRRVVGGGDR